MLDASADCQNWDSGIVLSLFIHVSCGDGKLDASLRFGEALVVLVQHLSLLTYTVLDCEANTALQTTLLAHRKISQAIRLNTVFLIP